MHLKCLKEIYLHTIIRLQCSFRTSQEWVFPIYCPVTTVQLYHLDSTLWKGVGGYSYPSLTWLSWAISFCVPPGGMYAYVSTPMFSKLWPLLSSLQWHGSHQTLSQSLYTAHVGTVLGISASPGRPVVSTPFKHCTSFHIGALQSIPPCVRSYTTFWSWSRHHCWFPSTVVWQANSLGLATLRPWQVTGEIFKDHLVSDSRQSEIYTSASE